jgi:hypothetical protein
MEWRHHAAQHDNYVFNPQRSSRNAQVKHLRNWLQCQNSGPQQISTMPPGPVEQVVQTSCFNFTNQLYSLVSDQALFGKLDNFDGNADTNSGQWYNTHTQLPQSIGSCKRLHDAHHCGL